MLAFSFHTACFMFYLIVFIFCLSLKRTLLHWMPTEWPLLIIVHWISTQCSSGADRQKKAEWALNVNWMWTECSLNLHWMCTECALNVNWMWTEFKLKMQEMCTESDKSLLFTLSLSRRRRRNQDALTCNMYQHMIVASGSSN
jgi:hypothetical protein